MAIQIEIIQKKIWNIKERINNAKLMLATYHRCVYLYIHIHPILKVIMVHKQVYNNNMVMVRSRMNQNYCSCDFFIVVAICIPKLLSFSEI